MGKPIFALIFAVIATERFKEHWLVSLLVLCAGVAGATWMLALNLLVAPRDFEIARLEKELAKAQRPAPQPLDLEVLPHTGVREGTAVSTTDGGCNIFIDRVAGDEAWLTVTMQSGASQKFERVRPGARLAVANPPATYFLDILSLRGNLVDLVVFRHKTKSLP